MTIPGFNVTTIAITLFPLIRPGSYFNCLTTTPFIFGHFIVVTC